MKITKKILTLSFLFCILCFTGTASAANPVDLEELAKSGNVDACYELGIMYFDGDGVKQDYKKALEYFQMGADQGDAYCQYNLAQMLRQGQGTSVNHAKALEWYNKAAAQGDTYAHFAIGVIYTTAENVKADYVKAYAHFIKASAEVDQAKEYCQLMAKEMSSAQINEAKAIANKLK